VRLGLPIFAWPSRHNVHLVFPLMLIFSFLLHASCVLLFSVTYPRSKSAAPKSAEVFFLQPGSREEAALAPFLNAEDPALFSPGQVFGRHVWKLPETAYVPSFDVKSPSLEPLPPGAAQPMLPPVSEAEFVGLKAPPPISGTPGLATTMRLGGGLAGRSFTPPAGFAFTAPGQALTPTSFMVAVSPDGLPMHLIPLPQATSGSDSLDRAALRYLAGTRFAADPAAHDSVWGTATFLWGADVARESQP